MSCSITRHTGQKKLQTGSQKLYVSSQSEILLHIAAQKRADRSALKAMSALGYTSPISDGWGDIGTSSILMTNRTTH